MTSPSNTSALNTASVVSRSARTVAERGARSSRPSSPTTSPRPSSASGDRRTVGAACSDTSRRPATTKKQASARVALLEQQLTRREMPPHDLVEHLLDERRLGVAHELGDHRRHLAAVDARSRLLRDGVGRVGIVGQPAFEVGPGDDGDLGRFDHTQRRRAPPTGDHGHLADDVTGPDRADDQLAPVRSVDRLEPAGEHDEHLVGLVALLDQHVAGRQRARRRGRAEVAEQRLAVVRVPPSCGPLWRRQ